ncbi:MAG: LAGLIDADG family homing endonuclease [Anaerolineales bacterium]
MYKKLSEQDRDEIAQRYRDGESSLELGKAYHVCPQTILNCLNARGVEVRNIGGLLTPSESQLLAAQYEAGLSSNRIAGQFKISHQVVLRSARRAGTQIRARNTYPYKRQYPFREDFFSTWSPEMAYVLGFCFADATVDRFSLLIYQKEIEVLEKIRSLINLNRPYKKAGTNRSIHALVLSSPKIMKDITKLGLIPNKSLIARVPGEVPYPADFVRGYFDGDGHGGWYKKRNKYILQIGFTSGSREFLLDLKELLPCNIGGPYQGKGHSFTLQTNRLRDAVTLRDWMYASCTDLCSSRKRDKLYPNC